MKIRRKILFLIIQKIQNEKNLFLNKKKVKIFGQLFFQLVVYLYVEIHSKELWKILKRIDLIG